VKLFLERIVERRMSDPSEVCIRVIDHRSGEDGVRTLTLDQLVAESQSVARRLKGVGVVPKDRVLLCLPNTERFAEWFLGTLWLDAIPVPLPSLSAFGVKGMLLERVKGVILDCKPKAIVGDAATARYLADAERSTTGYEALIDADEMWTSSLDPTAGELPFPDADPNRAALIQYTSGSTGKPRGVVVTHQNLAENLCASIEAVRLTKDDVTISWLPLYHDMGLIGGLLLALYCGFPTYLMQPLTFMTRPSAWLRAMSAHRATLSVAPNFAYSLCARKVRDDELEGIDLSAWRLAFNGAESVDPATVLEFVDRFSRFGLRKNAMFPVYGLAEATLSVAYPEPGDPIRIDHVFREGLRPGGQARPASAPGPSVAAFVSVGRALPRHAIEIQDPETGRVLSDRGVGEIIVRGPSISPYYFHADRAPPDGREALRTGDLGYIADGQLYVVDRIKDLIIIAGRSYVPSDIERALVGIEGVRMGRVAAFGVRDAESGTEALVVAAEARTNLPGTISEIEAGLRAVLLETFGLTPKDVLLLQPRALPRTSSGKIMRRTARDMYVEGKLVEKRKHGSAIARLTSAVRRWTTRM
jgi:acyl-CoA synthetase (AMP-forming)/AMP-acid ligase II